MRKRTSKLLLGIIAAALAAFLVTFHPARPLWMEHAEITLTARDGITLAATLSKPRWSEPIGAVVLVHGSGPLTRDHVRGDVRELVRLGFAVLHYDKRGAGSSGGTYMPSSQTPPIQLIDVLAADAAVAMDCLRARGDGRAVPLGYFGASQAGWIIPAADARSKTPADFHVILSGPAISTGMESYYSELTGDGSRPGQVEDQVELERRTLAWSGDPGYEPRPDWERLHVPTMWLLGGRDLSVPTFASVAALESLSRSGHPEHTVIQYPNAGHDLRDADTGEPVALWDPIAAWYGEHVTRR